MAERPTLTDLEIGLSESVSKVFDAEIGKILKRAFEYEDADAAQHLKAIASYLSRIHERTQEAIRAYLSEEAARG